MNRYKPVGWRSESHRHYLAGKGIATKYDHKRYFYKVDDVEKHGTLVSYKVHYDFDGALHRVESKRSGHFMNKDHRDAVAAKLKADGWVVKLKSMKSQSMHPEYVLDYEGIYDTGFGNSDYQHFFPTIYDVEIVR